MQATVWHCMQLWLACTCVCVQGDAMGRGRSSTEQHQLASDLATAMQCVVQHRTWTCRQRPSGTLTVAARLFWVMMEDIQAPRLRWYTALSGLMAHEQLASPTLTVIEPAARRQRYTAFGSYWLALHIMVPAKGGCAQYAGRGDRWQMVAVASMPRTIFSLPL